MPTLLRVDYPHLDGFMADYSENISQNGLFIATEQAHVIGEAVQFQISFAGLMQPLVLRGVVRWIRRTANSEGQPGIGVELIFGGREEAEAVARLAASAAGAAPAPMEARDFDILLVEDNPHVRDMLSYAVSKLAVPDQIKIGVVFAEDGGDAWDQLSVQDFDLLITDLYMPVLDGAELTRRIRKTPALKAMPIVAMSSGGPDARVEALAAGADIFLPKPVKLSDILATVGTLLRLTRS